MIFQIAAVRAILGFVLLVVSALVVWDWFSEYNLDVDSPLISVEVDDVSHLRYGGPDEPNGSNFRIKGIIKNNAEHMLQEVALRVTMVECPQSWSYVDDCNKLSETVLPVARDIRPGHVKYFSADHSFKAAARLPYTNISYKVERFVMDRDAY